MAAYRIEPSRTMRGELVTGVMVDSGSVRTVTCGPPGVAAAGCGGKTVGRLADGRNDRMRIRCGTSAQVP